MKQLIVAGAALMLGGCVAVAPVPVAPVIYTTPPVVYSQPIPVVINSAPALYYRPYYNYYYNRPYCYYYC